MSTTLVSMPNFGQTAAESVLASWLVEPGAWVDRGAVLAEAETDKTTVVIEAFAPGFVRRLLVEPPCAVRAGTTIAILTSTLDEPYESGNAASPNDQHLVASNATAPLADQQTLVSGAAGLSAGHQALAGDSAERPSLPPATTLAPAQSPLGAGPRRTAAPARPGASVGVLATPAAQRLALDNAIDLRGVRGTGPGGRILVEDVRRHAADEASGGAIAALAQPARDTTAPDGNSARPHNMTPMRAAIGARMVQSVREAPQFSLSVDVDLTEAERLRKRRASATGDRSVRISFTALLVKVVAGALIRYPELNAWFVDGGIHRHDAAHIGVAFATSHGLLVPVIRNAETLSLQHLTTVIASLREQAEAGRLPSSAIGGATFTLSNLGKHGVDRFTAILNPPEAGILAVGRAAYRPCSVGEAVVSRVQTTITLTADHRVVDGAEAAAFLSDVRHFLEQPTDLL